MTILDLKQGLPENLLAISRSACALGTTCSIFSSICQGGTSIHVNLLVVAGFNLKEKQIKAYHLVQLVVLQPGNVYRRIALNISKFHNLDNKKGLISRKACSFQW